MAWTDGAVFTNPASGTVLCQTPGVTLSGSHHIVVCASVNPSGVELLFQRRNAAGSIEQSQILPVVVGSFILTSPRADLAVGDRLAVVARESITGEVQASIFIHWEPR